MLDISETNISPAVEDSIKRVGLCLSDIISAKLKLIFNCQYYGKKNIPYEVIQKMDKKYYCFSLVNEKKQQVLNIIDTNIIYILANRILGGEGIVELRNFNELFTFSEKYFGKLLIDWVIDSFKKNGFNLRLEKIADSPRYYHIFLPEERVHHFTFEVFNGNQLAGMIYTCFANDYLRGGLL